MEIKNYSYLAYVLATGIAGCAKPEVGLTPSQIASPAPIRQTPTQNRPNIIVNWTIAGNNDTDSGCYEIFFPSNQFPREGSVYQDLTSKAQFDTQIGVRVLRKSPTQIDYEVVLGSKNDRNWPQSGAKITAHDIDFNQQIQTKSCYTDNNLDSVQINGETVTEPTPSRDKIG